jgi:primosomal protein N''
MQHWAGRAHSISTALRQRTGRSKDGKLRGVNPAARGINGYLSLRRAEHQDFEFRQLAAQASNSEQNHRSPYLGLIIVSA